MNSEAGLQKMEEYVISIEKIGEDITEKNSKRNKENTKKLKANKDKCDHMITSYTDAFNIHE